MLTEIALLELTFHSRAIEHLSPILTLMKDIDIEGDLQEYCKVELGIATGGPAAVRSESSASNQPTVKQPKTGPPAVTKIPSSSMTKPPVQSKMLNSSFDDDDDEEDDFEDDMEEYSTTETENASAARGASRRPLTGAKGPPVPERQNSAQKSFNPNLFLGSSGGK